MQDCHSSVSQNEVSERDQVARNRQQEKRKVRLDSTREKENRYL